MLETLTLPSAAWAMGDVEVQALMARLQPDALLNTLPTKAERGERLANERGVGVLFVHGPLFKRDSSITRTLGFTTYETLRRDLQAAIDDKTIDAVMLHVDSAGGEANGCDELANAIFEARRRKPVHAYVSGMACSAGYWIASAAEKITVSEASIIGSIGIALAMTQRNDPNDVQFVSSKAPGKRPDVTTDAGTSRVQKMVDDLADVFAAHVARNRGVSAETIARKFGAGGVLIGAKAVKAGMVDQVGQWPVALKAAKGSYIAHRANPRNLAISIPAVPALAVAAPVPASPVIMTAGEIAQAKQEALATARIAAICRSEHAQGHEELALKLAMETDMPVTEALKILSRAAASEGLEDAFANTRANRSIH